MSKFLFVTTVTSEFETKEAREHHIKNHYDAPYDVKHALLTEGKHVETDDDEELPGSVTLEFTEEN